MTKSKKGFGDDLIGAYATKQTEEVKSTGEVTSDNKDNKGIDNKYIKHDIDDKHNIDDKLSIEVKHVIDDEHNIDNKPTQKKRGRPKVTDRETRSKNFNLLMKPSTFKELNRLAGLKQAETGEKASITDLINALIDDYIAHQAKTA